jgi:beta-glucosidase
MVDLLRQEKIEPMVTLHHFTHPKWFIEACPWHHDRSLVKFREYVERVADELKGVRYWITFNEPNVLLLGGYLDGCMPPGIRDRVSYVRAFENVLCAHGTAYDILHASLPGAWVGVAHNMVAFSPYRRWNPLDQFLASTAHQYYNHSLLDALRTGFLRIRFPVLKKIERALPVQGKLDFLGVNYYTRIHVRFNPLRPMGLELKHEDRDGLGLTDMGWEIHPRGMERTLKEASKLGLPIIITENGVATRDGQKKEKFIKSHLDILEQCLQRGMDIRGYFYWSLMDNYEWLKGLDAKFGLYSVNYDTLERKATPVAGFYSYLIKKRSHF